MAVYLNERASQDALGVLNHAQQEAERRHGNVIDVEHLLLGLTRQTSGTAFDLLQKYGVAPFAIYQKVAAGVGMERPSPAPVKGLSRDTKTLLERTVEEMKALHQPVMDSGHLLIGLMGESNGLVQEALADLPFNLDEARAFMREQPAAQPAAPPIPSSRPAAATARPGGQREVVLVPMRKGATRQPPGSKTAPRSSNRLWIVLGIVALVGYLVAMLPTNQAFTFLFILIGWVFSLCLHEFSHALVAYWGGDYTVKDKGYLSFNPLKYMHPTLSILMPLLFLAMGGIGLPGGAVYIERHRLKNKWWGAAVSAAGPTANLLLALVLSLPFLLGLVDINQIADNIRFSQAGDGSLWQNTTLWSAVGFLIMLQITSVFFNLLPIPPLDGFGVLEPFLDERTQFQLRQMGMFGLLLLLVIMWTPLGDPFWQMVFDAVRSLGVPGWLISEGFRNFLFWREPPA
jgi:Zn-dependent protease